VNSKNILESYEKKIVKLEIKEQAYKDSIVLLQEDNFELLYFNIKNNDDALTYFENDGLDITTIEQLITDALYTTNEYKGEDHPLIPYASMTDNKMIINTLRIINHKWVIANYTDGKYWGEIFLKYEIDKENKVSFNLVEYLLYTQ
jgi:hypothetical protein